MVHLTYIQLLSQHYKLQSVSRAQALPALYDLSTDPAETQDLSTEKSETLNVMLARLEPWIHSVADSAEKEVGCMLSAP